MSLAALTARIEKLEKSVFGNGEAKSRGGKKEIFKGATGGVRLLVSNGYFDEKRQFAQITSELEKLGYHYSKQAVQEALNRLSHVGGPLVSLVERGRKAYAKRK